MPTAKRTLATVRRGSPGHTDKTARETTTSASQRTNVPPCKEIKLAGIGQRLLGMERAMGIENTAGAHNLLEIMTLQPRRALRAIIV
jgi:hypothetical protein